MSKRKNLQKVVTVATLALSLGVTTTGVVKAQEGDAQPVDVVTNNENQFVTRWLEEGTNKVLKEEVVNDATMYPDEEGDDIENYFLARVATDNNDHRTTNYYVKKKKVTKWLEADTNKVLKEEVVTENEMYPDDEGDDIEGYALVKTVEETNNEVTTTTNIYKTRKFITYWVLGDDDNTQLKEGVESTTENYPDNEGDDLEGYTLEKVSTKMEDGVKKVYNRYTKNEVEQPNQPEQPSKPEKPSNPEQPTTQPTTKKVKTYWYTVKPNGDLITLKEEVEGEFLDLEGDDIEGYELEQAVYYEGNVHNQYKYKGTNTNNTTSTNVDKGNTNKQGTNEETSIKKVENTTNENGTSTQEISSAKGNTKTPVDTSDYGILHGLMASLAGLGMLLTRFKNKNK